MKFSTREDVAAASTDVFAALTDFERHERQALRRGADVMRKDQLSAPGVGMAWDIWFTYRGRRRRAETTLTKYEPDASLAFASKVGGLDCAGEIELSALGPAKTRMHVTFDLKPQTFRARMLIRGLKLAKGNLATRFKSRVARFARGIEARP